MDSYPLMVDIENKKAIVIGGGKVALRKIRSLLRARADVVVISPKTVPAIEKLETEGNLIWCRKEFSPDDLSDAFLVIAATNHREVNEAVAHSAYPRQLVNVADNPNLGNFHMPSVLDRGRLTIAVSTGGASPGLTQKIRDELGESYDESYSHYVDFLYKCREMIKHGSFSREQKEDMLKRLLDPKYLDPVRQRETLLGLEELRKEGAEP
ncbi:MAG TPA: NAD(P)-binding protein [Bacillales bacterium]|nr:NAD(P)-binding protein [Bacillales bacterium]